MFKIPLEKIIEIIKEKTGLTEEEINNKIKEKSDQLSGLVSKEGAAHILANSLGIKLFEVPKGNLQIKNILSGMRDVETAGRVTQVFDLKQFKTEKREGQLASFVLADETGSVRIVMWNEQANNISKLSQNDIVMVKGGSVRENQGRLEIHIGERSGIFINPPNLHVPEIDSAVKRKPINELKETDNNVEIMGTIVQVFEPRFYETCPSCNRKALLKEDGFYCTTHGPVQPGFAYVMNVVVDDGTDNIRTVFFRDQAAKLSQKTHDEMLTYKEFPAQFEAVKNSLLGTQIKVSGRASKNQLFERIEFVAQKVSEANPEEEIKRLEKEIVQ